MKCEYNEEDDERSELLPLGIEMSTLKPSSLPFIKEEIKNEPDCHSSQLKLESTIESALHSIIKPEKTSNAPDSGVCEELHFKEELCFDESSIDVSENKIQFGQNFTNEIHKNVYIPVMNDQIMDTKFLNNESISL
uniref:Uncharacterized protein n=1 Tax=Timema poppense TaxID=170557 RepID=A0A7R9HBQ2_TIMPO|nr:unnamed protein product [Timema poppensis]